MPFAIAFGWTFGLAAGRVSNRRLTLRQRVLLGTILTALASAGSVLAPSWVVFLLLRALGGIGANIASPAVIALCVRATPPARRGTALGIVQSSTLLAGSFPGADRADGRGGSGRQILAVASAAAILTLLWLTLMSQGGVPLLERWLDIDIAAAGRLLGWFGLGSTVSALGVSAWSDRGRGPALAVSGLATAAAGGGLAIAALLDVQPATWLVALAIGLPGLGMGILPMAISILPSDAVVEGDVDRAVEIPIISAELIGAATLPALAFTLAARIGIEWLLLTAAGAFAVLAVVGGLVLHRWLPPRRTISGACPTPR